MSIQSVTLTFAAKRANGQNLSFQTSAGGTLSTLTATAANGSTARAAIQTLIDTSIAIAQGATDEQNEVSGLFNS